jgi:hypothetical protein
MKLKTAIEQEETEGTENKKLRSDDFRMRVGFPINHPDGEADERSFLDLKPSPRFLCLLLLRFCMPLLE